MIVITHDLSILAQIADTILIMYAGKLAEKADAATIVDLPLHPYTQMLLGVAARGRRALQRRRPGRDPRAPAFAARPADGLPVQGALPVRFRQVRRGPSFHRTEARPSGGVLEGDAGDLGSEACRGGPGGQADEHAPDRQGLEDLQVRHLRRRPEAGPAQVSFGIDRGEVVSLIGESGSGKSTLGKIILRLTPLSAGRVLFEGTDVIGLKKKHLHEYYRHVQGVFQDPFSSYNPLYKADRVFEMLRQEYFSGLSRAGMGRQSRRRRWRRWPSTRPTS